MNDRATAPSIEAVNANHPPIRGAHREPSWQARFSRVLGLLPWSAGEHLLASVGVLDGLVRPARLRRALDWASAQPRGRHGRWSLALRLLANHGRFIAQEHTVRGRAPAALRDHVRVSGTEHLAAIGERGAILLGFHVGPPGTAHLLRVLGYPVTSVHGLVKDPSEHSNQSCPPEQEQAHRAVTLYRARRHLAGQGWLYMPADGPPGTEAYRISLPGGPVIVREGWLTLRRLTEAPTLPVLAHLEGHRRVIAIHPPLPEVSRDGADVAPCRAELTNLLGAYLRRFPEQWRATLWRP